MKPFRQLTLLFLFITGIPLLLLAQPAPVPAPDVPVAEEAASKSEASVATSTTPEAPTAPEAPAPVAEAEPIAIVEASAEVAPPVAESAEKPDDVAPPAKKSRSVKVSGDRNEVVGIGQDVHIKAGERVREVVVIFGNLTMDGIVDGEVVVIGGRAKINGPVGGEMVLVLSDGELGPNASIGGDAVTVGGRLANPHDVRIGGSKVSIEQHLPEFGVALDWFREGLILGRPIVPGLSFTWIVAGAFLAFYLFLALILGRAVNATASSLEERPGGTLLAALLFLPAFPLFVLILVMTGIGVLLLPFVMIGLFFATLFGKVAFLAFVGRALLRPAGPQVAGVAILSTLVGGIIITLLYGVWYLGFALWALTTWIGIGMVIMTIFTALKRERPRPAPMPPGAPAPTPGVPPAPAGAAPGESSSLPLSAAAASGIAGAPAQSAPEGETPAGVSGFAAGAAGAAGASPPPSPAPVPPVYATSPYAMSPTSATGYERAAFGIRLAAILIDVILVGAVVAPLGGGSAFALFLGLYCGLLWFFRGTTVGGIICGLKIVRLDGRPVDVATSVVRTLGAFLSMICVGLGFLWVIWDPEKQTWHDKIAGTTVIRVPKGMSLV